MHISGIYRSTTLIYIEMPLQNIARTETRDIPRPRPRPKMPAPADQVKKLNVVQRLLPRFRPLAMAPAESNLPHTRVERVSAPDILQTPGVDTADWVPGPQVQETAGEFLIASSYLDMVRLKIVSRKRYPESAKSRGIDGRVTIRFVLAADGTLRERDVTITRGAGIQSFEHGRHESGPDGSPLPEAAVKPVQG